MPLDPLPQEESTLLTALDYLGRPSRAVAGAVRAYNRGDDPIQRALLNLRGTKEDDFDDVLADQGYADGWGRRAAGFAGDVALDPLNLVPVGAATKGIGKVLGAAGDMAGTGLRAAGLEGVVDGARAVTDAFGEAFVPYYALRNTPEYAKLRRLFDSERRTLPNRVFDDVATRYQGLSPEQRKAVGLALDAGDDPAGIADAGIRTALDAQRRVYDRLGQEGVSLGILDADAVKAKAGRYAPYVFRDEGGFFRDGPLRGRRVNPTSPFAKERKTATLLEAIANGAEPDAAVAALIRELDGERARQSAQFLHDTVAKFATDTPTQGYVRLGDLVPLAEGQKVSLGSKWVPMSIAEDLKKVVSVGDQRAPLLKGLDAVMQKWRTGATVLRPGFHATNLIGNLYNSALGGLSNPLRIAQRNVQGLASSTASPALVRSLGNYDPAQINDLMRKHGLTPVGGGDAFGAGELQNVATATGLASSLKKTLDPALQETTLWDRVATPWRAYSRAMHGLGNTIEGGSKRALFYDELAKGVSPEDAILAVKDKLFDYAELTDLEKNVGRNVLPFYTWTRKNVPLQLKSLVDNPAIPARVAHGTDSLEDLGEDRGTATPFGLRPEWYQKQGYLPLPVSLREGAQAYVNPYLPLADLNKIPGLGAMSSLEDAAGDVVSGISPVIKAPLELALNRDFFQKKEVYDSALGFLGDRQKAPALFQIPGLRDVAQVLPGISRDPETGETVLPVASNYAFEQALPFLSSVGRAGHSAMSPEEASNAAGAWKFLGVPLTERTALQQQRDALAAANRQRRLATALQGQAALDTATFDDTDARAARLLARFLAEP